MIQSLILNGVKDSAAVFSNERIVARDSWLVRHPSGHMLLKVSAGVALVVLLLARRRGAALICWAYVGYAHVLVQQLVEQKVSRLPTRASPNEVLASISEQVQLVLSSAVYFGVIYFVICCSTGLVRLCCWILMLAYSTSLVLAGDDRLLSDEWIYLFSLSFVDCLLLAGLKTHVALLLYPFCVLHAALSYCAPTPLPRAPPAEWWLQVYAFNSLRKFRWALWAQDSVSWFLAHLLAAE